MSKEKIIARADRADFLAVPWDPVVPEHHHAVVLFLGHTRLTVHCIHPAAAEIVCDLINQYVTSIVVERKVNSDQPRNKSQNLAALTQE